MRTDIHNRVARVDLQTIPQIMIENPDFLDRVNVKVRFRPWKTSPLRIRY